MKVYESIASNFQLIKDEKEMKILDKHSERGRRMTIGYSSILIKINCFSVLKKLCSGQTFQSKINIFLIQLNFLKKF